MKVFASRYQNLATFNAHCRKCGYDYVSKGYEKCPACGCTHRIDFVKNLTRVKE